MGREFEVKLRAPSTEALRAVEEDLAVAAAAWGKVRPIQMESVYYDTPGRTLSERRWTLRRRRENSRYVVTVKTPSSGLGRGEWEVEGESVMGALPELCEKGAPAELLELTASGVLPCCGASFQRKALDLRLPDGTRAELALDHGFLTGGNRREPLLEVELELKSGSEEAVVRFCGDLARRHSLMPEGKSKFARAAALAEEI